MSPDVATDLFKLKRQIWHVIKNNRGTNESQQRMNFLLILKHSYDLSFQSRSPAAFIWLSWHSNLWHRNEWQLPALLRALTVVTYRPVHLWPCSPNITEFRAPPAFAADISGKNKQHRHNMNCMDNLANINIKVPNDLSLLWTHRNVKDSTSPFRSSGIPWGVLCSSFTHTDLLKNLQWVKSCSLSLWLVQKLNYMHSCPQKSRWEMLSIICHHPYMWLTFWLFPSCSSLISLH